MGFEGILGNEGLIAGLRAASARGRLSHFYLICGPEGSGRHTLAKLLARAMLCEGSDAPCGMCRACRKVENGTHPDFIVADDPAAKTVTVEFVRSIRSDVFIRPNEGRKKIYLFPRAQDIRLEGQNALLKVLEEPPEYGVFLLLTDNPDKLLPTIRSRCVEVHMRPLEPALLRRTLTAEFPDAQRETVESALLRSGGYLGQARKLMEGGSLSDQTLRFARSYAGRDTLGLLEVLVGMEKWKRDQVIPELSQWLEILEQALAARAGMPAGSAAVSAVAGSRRSRELMDGCAALKKAVDYAQSNVSCAAVCGWLSWELR